jgi:FkbM family methyltransferase
MSKTALVPWASNGHAVLAIAADATNYAALVIAAEANAFPRFTPVHLAAFSKTAIVRLKGGSPWCQIDPAAESGELVFAAPLAQILRAFGFADADLIKIDVEGSESAALTGIKSIVQDNLSVEFLYECNSHTLYGFDTRPQNLIGGFEQLGFRNFMFMGDHLMRTDSGKPHPHLITDNLATRVAEDEIGFLRISEFSYGFAQHQLSRAAAREIRFHNEHALRQEPYLPLEFRAGPAWANAKRVIAERTRSLDAAAHFAGGGACR